MKITAQSTYVCLALLELTRNYRKEAPISVHTLASRFGIPEKFLLQLLSRLKRLGLIESYRGSLGGYRLAQSPETLTVGSVLRKLETQRSEVERTENPLVLSAEDKVVHQLWQDAEARQEKLLDETTFAALLLRCEHETLTDFSI